MSLFQNLSIVLERPRGAGNIGAVARAMKNTALSNLILVDPCPYLVEEGFRMAMGSIEILKKARVVASMEEALHGFQVVIGTTRRRGRIRKALLTPREVGAKVLESVPANKVALVFGNEKDGLSNPDLFQCHWISNIPANPKQPSLNLAQAVLVYCYELYVAGLEKTDAASLTLSPAVADQQTREKMYQMMDQTLARIGFYEHGSPHNLLRSLRQLFGKSNLSYRDIRILKGIFAQMNRVLDNGTPDDLP